MPLLISLKKPYEMILVLMLTINLHISADNIASSICDNEEYRSFCNEAANNPTIFKNFRRHLVYRDALEHVKQHQGDKLLKIIQNKYPDLLNNWDKFLKNDLIGNPITYYYRKIGRIAPTTLRYIKILGDLEKFFGDINGKSIIEIGGGYGGQCKIICDRFSPLEYSIVDLKEPIALTEKYLSILKVTDANSISLIKSEDTEPKTCDIFISNYAFSECTKEVQDEYLEKYIFHSKTGYMIFNTWKDFPFESYSHEDFRDRLIENDFDVHITAENPSTSSQNLLIVWFKK